MIWLSQGLSKSVYRMLLSWDIFQFDPLSSCLLLQPAPAEFQVLNRAYGPRVVSGIQGIDIVASSPEGDFVIPIVAQFQE